MARIVRIIDKDRGWKRFQKDAKKLNGTISKIGLFGEGSSPANNIAYRGAVHELGLGHNPKRPFMRNAFDKFNNDLFKFVGKTFILLQIGKVNVSRFIGLTSEWFVTKIKEEIRAGDFKPLKPATVRRKGTAVILIHTAQMINSLTFRMGKK